ncbi:hypothetical protein V1264_003917 [Littorina saxatilis]|uniref:Uncharacterized protein n=1 Tax=Littorina saxatilis TaxID=31220 RepID=A0AAN9G6N2_9CAEN
MTPRVTKLDDVTSAVIFKRQSDACLSTRSPRLSQEEQSTTTGHIFSLSLSFTCSCRQNLTVEDDEACDDRCPGPVLPFRACSCSAGTKRDNDLHCECDSGERDQSSRFVRPRRYRPHESCHRLYVWTCAKIGDPGAMMAGGGYGTVPITAGRSHLTVLRRCAFTLRHSEILRDCLEFP